MRTANDPVEAATASKTRGEETARLLRLAAGAPESQRGRLQEQVVELNLVVARAVAHRYRGRGVPLDDLEQVAALGLVKAVRRFDPGYGKDFLAYAVPMMTGEVRRYFRDHAWMVKVPRAIQDLQPRIAAAMDQLPAQLGGSPTAAQVAGFLGEEPERVVDALACAGCFRPVSLDPDSDPASPRGRDGSLLAVVGHDDPGYEAVEIGATITAVLKGSASVSSTSSRAGSTRSGPSNRSPRS